MRKPILAALALAVGAAAAAEPDLSRLEPLLRGAKPDSVRQTPVPGLYEVVIGTQIVYLSGDGRYVLRGDLLDLEHASNLTQAREGGLRKAAIDAVPANEMIVFAPMGQPKHTVTIFTDIDCGYCRKLHGEITNYNRAGIEVRYLAYPRTGPAGESYDKAVSVWCAQDRKSALTQAKLGKPVPAASCDNPVAKHYELGNRLGVQGTPSIVLESGEMVPGYVPAAELAQMLEK